MSGGCPAFWYKSLLTSLTPKFCISNQIMKIQAFHTPISKAGISVISPWGISINLTLRRVFDLYPPLLSRRGGIVRLEGLHPSKTPLRLIVCLAYRHRISLPSISACHILAILCLQSSQNAGIAHAQFIIHPSLGGQ